MPDGACRLYIVTKGRTEQREVVEERGSLRTKGLIIPWLVFPAVMLTAPGVASGNAWISDLKSTVQPRNLGLAVAGLGAAAIAHHWDAPAHRKLDGSAVFKATSGFTDLYG